MKYLLFFVFTFSVLGPTLTGCAIEPEFPVPVVVVPGGHHHGHGNHKHDDDDDD